MTDWTRISKLAGMLGSPHDGERINAARLLAAALEKENMTFADFSQRIANNGPGVPVVRYVTREVVREIVRVERPTPNPAAAIASDLVNRCYQKLAPVERGFLKSIVTKADMTNGKFVLTGPQAQWLLALRDNHAKRTVMPTHRTPDDPKPVAADVLEELGLGPAPDRDVDDAIGGFRAKMAGESHDHKVKPDQRTVDGKPDARYRGDFLNDPLTDDLGLGDERLPWEE